MEFVFDAELVVWEVRTDSLWTFVRLPPDASAEIADRAAGRRLLADLSEP